VNKMEIKIIRKVMRFIVVVPILLVGVPLIYLINDMSLKDTYKDLTNTIWR